MEEGKVVKGDDKRRSGGRRDDAAGCVDDIDLPDPAVQARPPDTMPSLIQRKSG